MKIEFLRLLQVVEAFLKKKATYGDLRKAAEEARKTIRKED